MSCGCTYKRLLTQSILKNARREYMSSQEPPNGPPASSKPEDASASESTPLLVDTQDGEAAMDTTPDQPPEETWEDIPEDVRNAGVDEITTRARLIDNDIRVGTLIWPRRESRWLTLIFVLYRNLLGHAL